MNFKSRGTIDVTIGELAARTDTPASTIRYWERIGVLPRPERASGRRRYSSDAVEHLAVLHLAQNCGFRLDELRRLMHGFKTGVTASRRWRRLAGRKQLELDAQITRVKDMRRLINRVLQCRCTDLSECGRIARDVLGSTE